MLQRRQFLSNCISCSAYISGLAAFAPRLMASAFGARDDEKVVVKEKWGRIEEIQDGVWALISTPFDSRDFTTVCNGGIIKGDQGVLAVESFMQAKGATWLAEQAKKLTGNWPTDFVSSHFHADHSAGHKGYFVDKHNPNCWLTESTKTAAEKSFQERGMDDNQFENVKELKRDGKTEIDLGNRQVTVVSRAGHTTSDVTIEISDPKVVWCGDLFFNRMFPNYGDATPSKLNSYVEGLLEAPDITYVPGHGPIADLDAIKQYKELLALVEDAAKKSFKAGKSVDEQSKDFKLPDSLSKWTIWSPDNAKRAFNAWYRELRSSNYQKR